MAQHRQANSQPTQNTELRDDFRLALQTYVPMSDIQTEFPDAGTILGTYGDAVPPFTMVWGDLVENDQQRPCIDWTRKTYHPQNRHTHILLSSPMLLHAPIF